MFNKFSTLLLLITIGFGFSANNVQAEEKKTEAKKPSYYLIGNSLTWDTLPGWLDGDVQYHIDWGKPLSHIFEHPKKPGLKESTLWTKALKEKQYDFVTVQPYYGSTLASDVEAISKWMEMQPKATFIIHDGWATHKTRAEEYASKEVTGKMIHSPGYYKNLMTELKKQHPDCKIQQLGANKLLETIAQDIKNKKGPFKDIKDLYRDTVHINLESGRYLMHNAMRIALKQPMSGKRFKRIPEEHKAYFDKLLKELK